MNLHNLKLLMLSVILILVGITLHAQQKLSEEALSPDIFSVQIWQEGEMIQEKNGSYELEKKAFTVVFKWERAKVDGVYAFIDTDPLLFNRVEKGPIPFQNELYVITMADREYNTNKVLMLSDSFGVNFFSDPTRGGDNYSRFNKMVSTQEIFTGFREVESFQIPGKQYHLADMTQPVYLFCFATNSFEYQKENGVHILKRMGLKISWK